ncbi:MAG: flagellar biosynthesis protein FliQ [Treponema sp.]|uniref:flagellar biosynthesis protein FliQ n=1 Tax=Treponema sp. TaxID=166 RepID=UPI001B3F8A73|nr:flagellar biosynthesis protein FliQ [Treponema sp.]MBP5587810.1 flagellar biosynthesis protein FliQ [Treponema sp.]MCR5385766.1 flagellar biosynthesis protein FliQ [Treponema sp.]
MSLGEVISLMRNGIMEVLILIAPILGVALIVGLIVAIFQATTSIQEQTLTFLPKLLAILLMLALLGGWMFTHLSNYTRMLFESIPAISI